MHVTPIRCLRDNYAYLVSSDRGEDAVVIDASEDLPVRRELARSGRRLAAILSTHHHWDHVGGNEGFARGYPGLPIFGHRSDVHRLPGITHPVEGGTSFELAGILWRVLHVPGHTLGAVAYLAEGAVFTGDTLFVAGCGRLFEGTPQMMVESLYERIGALPPDTQVYCGHEYTRANLEFARFIEPSNSAVARLLVDVAGAPPDHVSVPSTISRERDTNPFMRCTEASIATRALGDTGSGKAEPAKVLAALRRLKEGFRYP